MRSSACTKSDSKRFVRPSTFWVSAMRFLSLAASASIRVSASDTEPWSDRTRSSNASNSFFLTVSVPTSDRSDSSSPDESRCSFDVSRWTS